MAADRLRDRTLPWLVIGAVALAWTILAPDTHQGHDVRWTGDVQRPEGIGLVVIGGAHSRSVVSVVAPSSLFSESEWRLFGH